MINLNDSSAKELVSFLYELNDQILTFQRNQKNTNAQPKSINADQVQIDILNSENNFSELSTKLKAVLEAFDKQVPPVVFMDSTISTLKRAFNQLKQYNEKDNSDSVPNITSHSTESSPFVFPNYSTSEADQLLSHSKPNNYKSRSDNIELTYKKSKSDKQDDLNAQLLSFASELNLLVEASNQRTGDNETGGQLTTSDSDGNGESLKSNPKISKIFIAKLIFFLYIMSKVLMVCIALYFAFFNSSA